MENLKNKKCQRAHRNWKRNSQKQTHKSATALNLTQSHTHEMENGEFYWHSTLKTWNYLVLEGEFLASPLILANRKI